MFSDEAMHAKLLRWMGFKTTLLQIGLAVKARTEDGAAVVMRSAFMLADDIEVAP
jgi:hypothetical protein